MKTGYFKSGLQDLIGCKNAKYLTRLNSSEPVVLVLGFKILFSKTTYPTGLSLMQLYVPKVLVVPGYS